MTKAKPLFRPADDEKIDVWGSLAFFIIHLSVLLVFVCGFSWFALAVGVLMYAVRMVAVTGGYHRYFSHKTYKTSRPFQFFIAWMGACCAQKGPLWWAAHHRHHHRYSDTPTDIHSPVQRGFWWSHVGWILCRKYKDTNLAAIRDLTPYPELAFIDRHYLVPPTTMAVALFVLGVLLNRFEPGLHVNGFQMLVWGFFVSTVVLYHGTFTINSLSHVFGRRRFETKDTSRNNFWLALITMGEGWHNNHHRYPASERQGFYWWEIDVTHYVLRALSWFRLVWDLQTPPAQIFAEAKELKVLRRLTNPTPATPV